MAMQNFPVHRNHIQTFFIIIGLLMLLIVPVLYHTHPPKVNSVKIATASQKLDNPLPVGNNFSAVTYASMAARPAPAPMSQVQSPVFPQSRLPDESAPALVDDLVSQPDQKKPKPLKAATGGNTGTDNNDKGQKGVENNN
jgi:hypothetical protein